MAATVTSADPAPENLDLYRLRDELAEVHEPANAHERMLVTAIAQAWLRLERAHELEARYCASRDVLEVLTTKPKEFQAITRFVTDSERAWRHAVVMLERTQRRRRRETLASPNARRASQRPPVPAQPPAPAPVVNPQPAPVAVARRE